VSVGPIFRFARRSATWLRPHRGLAIVIALGLVLEAAFTAAVPLAFRMLIDRAITPRDTTLLVTVVVAMTIGVAVVAAAGLWRDYLYARVCSMMLRDLRLQMFDQVHRLTPSSVATEDAGEGAHFSTDLAAIEHAVVSAVPWALLPALDVVIGTTLLFALEWRLALIAALVFPLALIGPRVVAPRATRASRDRKNQEAAVLVEVQENISARQTVRAFRLEQLMRGRFAGRVDELVASSTRTGFLGALVERSAGIGILLLQVVVLGVGALMAFEGMLTIGTLVSFQALFMTVSWSLAYITQYVPNLVVAAGALHRIDDYLAASAPVTDQPGALPLPRCTRDIRFEGVVYGFPNMPPILRGLDLSLRAGERVAIVGGIGSGKSTVLRLLARFADPSAGRILIDGHDIRGGTQESLRRQIGVVFQDGLLLNDTIRENIRLGKLDATDSEMEAVSALVGLHDLVEQLPRGYDTVVGPRGERLSGGQRQLVAIARAVLRDPAILLLDEPTSALDPYSDQIVRLAIEHVSRGPTVIAITHRRELAAEADRVLVMKDGRVVEDGNHAALLRPGTLYSRLWRDAPDDSRRDLES
jgi:ATP-binding cassette subfamily B protein